MNETAVTRIPLTLETPNSQTIDAVANTRNESSALTRKYRKAWVDAAEKLDVAVARAERAEAMVDVLTLALKAITQVQRPA